MIPTVLKPGDVPAQIDDLPEGAVVTDQPYTWECIEPNGAK